MSNENFNVERQRLDEMLRGLDGRIAVAVGVGSGAEVRELHHTLADLAEAGAIPEHVGGFVFFVSGYLCAAAHGLPDLGYVLRSEIVRHTDIVEQASWMAALDRGTAAHPIGVDIDTGYGSEPSAVLLTCRQVHKQGAAYVQIEDQLAINKSCGHMDGPRGTGKEVIDVDEMIEARLAPALAYAAGHDDFLVAARTDALAGHGLDEALQRAHRYVEAGAHMIFVEAPGSDDELATIGSELAGSGAINVANMVEGSDKTPFKTPRELQELGFQLALYPVGPFLAGHDAQRRYYDRLGRGTPTPAAAERMGNPFEQFNRVIGRPQTEAWNERFRRTDKKPR